MLDSCKAAGIACVISMCQFPIDPSKGLTELSAAFWGSAAELADAVRVAGVLALNFRGRGAELGGYEFLNEPLVRSHIEAVDPPQWPGLMRDIIAGIRRHDPERWIVITPGAGGVPGGYRGFSPLEDSRIVYGARMYEPLTFTRQGMDELNLGFAYPGRIYTRFWNRRALSDFMTDLIGFQKKYNVPVWIDEFSAARWAPGAEKYLLDLASEFNSRGWGWSYSGIGGYHGWNPDYDTGFSSDKTEEIETHYRGDGSVRWSTLKKIFRLQ